MPSAIYPVRLHELEEERNDLLMRKVQLEHRLRLLREQYLCARDKRENASHLAAQRDEALYALEVCTLELLQLRQRRRLELVSYKTAFLKMAKRILPRDVYRQVAIAANDYIRTKSMREQQESKGEDDHGNAQQNRTENAEGAKYAGAATTTGGRAAADDDAR